MTDSLPTLTIIGPGRVGTTLAALMHRFKLCKINQVIARSNSNEDAIKLIGAGIPAKLSELKYCDIIMVTLPDDGISDIYQSIQDKIKPGTIVFHCSGILPSLPCKDDVLSASVHPLKSFAEASNAIENFKGTACAIEGHSLAVENLTALFQCIGGYVIPIQSEDKGLWHLAGVMSSNYLNGLIHLTQSLYKRMGLNDNEIESVLSPLATHTLSQILSMGTTKALTGPMERGDVKTIEKHLQTLDKLPQSYTNVYRHLGEWVLKVSQLKGNASKESTQEIAQLLTNTSNK